MNIEETENQIRRCAAKLLTDESIELCSERLAATDRSYMLPIILGMAMTGIRLKGDGWRADLVRTLRRDVDDKVAATAVEWAVDALEERNEA